MSANLYPQVLTPFTRLATVTSTGTWNHPDGIGNGRFIRVICISGGGGGGSGAVGNATTFGSAIGSGAGGAGGLVQWAEGFITSSASITIGAGGVGGTGVTKTGSGSLVGNNGADGGDSIFSATGMYVRTQISGYNSYVGRQTFGTGGSILGAYSKGGSGGSGGGAGIWANPGEAGGSYGRPNYLGDVLNYGGSGYVIAPYATTSSQRGLIESHLALYAPGGGGAGGGSDIDGNAGGAGGYGFAANNGGAGSAGKRTNTANGTATSLAGTTPTGYGGGGGGSGSAIVINATITSAVSTSGAGGNGAPGVVYIYY